MGEGAGGGESTSPTPYLYHTGKFNLDLIFTVTTLAVPPARSQTLYFHTTTSSHNPDCGDSNAALPAVTAGEIPHRKLHRLRAGTGQEQGEGKKNTWMNIMRAGEGIAVESSCRVLCDFAQTPTFRGA